MIPSSRRRAIVPCAIASGVASALLLPAFTIEAGVSSRPALAVLQWPICHTADSIRLANATIRLAQTHTEVNSNKA